MTRTYKDRESYTAKLSSTRYWNNIPERGSFPKKRKTYVDRHCMSTPAWWWRMTTTKCRRRESRVWERKVILDEELEPYLNWKKPQEYYW